MTTTPYGFYPKREELPLPTGAPLSFTDNVQTIFRLVLRYLYPSAAYNVSATCTTLRQLTLAYIGQELTRKFGQYNDAEKWCLWSVIHYSLKECSPTTYELKLDTGRARAFFQERTMRWIGHGVYYPRQDPFALFSYNATSGPIQQQQSYRFSQGTLRCAPPFLQLRTTEVYAQTDCLSYHYSTYSVTLLCQEGRCVKEMEYIQECPSQGKLHRIASDVRGELAVYSSLYARQEGDYRKYTGSVGVMSLRRQALLLTLLFQEQVPFFIRFTNPRGRRYLIIGTTESPDCLPRAFLQVVYPKVAEAAAHAVSRLLILDMEDLRRPTILAGAPTPHALACYASSSLPGLEALPVHKWHGTFRALDVNDRWLVIGHEDAEGTSIAVIDLWHLVLVSTIPFCRNAPIWDLRFCLGSNTLLMTHKRSVDQISVPGLNSPVSMVLWDLQTGAQTVTCTLMTCTVVAQDRDSWYLRLSDETSAVWRLYKCTGQSSMVFSFQELYLDFSVDGERIASVSASGVRVQEIHSARILFHEKISGVSALKLYKGSLFIGMASGSIMQWNVTPPKLIQTIHHEVPDFVLRNIEANEDQVVAIYQSKQIPSVEKIVQLRFDTAKSPAQEKT